MKLLIALFVLWNGANAGVLVAQGVLEEGSSMQFRNEDNAGNYNFGYDESHTSGGSYRREEGNALGVKGSYGLMDADGRVRVVNYVADGYGFRAAVATNEPGTVPSTPAGVNVVPPEASVAVKGTGPANLVAPSATPLHVTHAAHVPATAAHLAHVRTSPVTPAASVAPVVPVATGAHLRQYRYFTAYPGHGSASPMVHAASPIPYPAQPAVHAAYNVVPAKTFLYGHRIVHDLGNSPHRDLYRGYAYS